jgi:hypothetical protein
MARTQPHPPASKVLHTGDGTPPIVTGLIVTDWPSGRRTIQDAALIVTLDAQDRVRSAYYLWDRTPLRISRVPKPGPDKVPSLAWTEQQNADAYWRRVSEAFPRPNRAAVSQPA